MLLPLACLLLLVHPLLLLLLPLARPRDRPVPIPAPGVQLVTLTHVEDVASMLAAVPGNSAAIRQHYNVCSDRAVTFSGAPCLHMARSAAPAPWRSGVLLSLPAMQPASSPMDRFELAVTAMQMARAEHSSPCPCLFLSPLAAPGIVKAVGKALGKEPRVVLYSPEEVGTGKSGKAEGFPFRCGAPTPQQRQDACMHASHANVAFASLHLCMLCFSCRRRCCRQLHAIAA